MSRLAADAGGASFACDLGDQISREVCLTGLYEPPVTRLVQQHLRPGGIVVDVGANWGYFSLLAAAAVGASGKVFALEPDPRQFETLSSNVSANGFRHVSPLQAAASAAEGRLSLVGYEDGERNRGVSRLADPASSGRHFDVRATSVDRVTAGCPSVDIVKIDVEGAEDAVLEGMREGLTARRYRALVLELHPDLLRARQIDPASCVARLLEYGYRGWTIDLDPGAYRRALDPAVDIESLLGPLESWRDTPWPHLLWLC
jgi:FkbM family methyltransferase